MSAVLSRLVVRDEFRDGKWVVTSKAEFVERMPDTSLEAETAARDHALRSWPAESCGVIAEGRYVMLPNEAVNSAETFRLPARTFVDHAVEAVIHSHCAPRHDRWPSAADMASQVDTAVPWGIVWSDGTAASGPLWFGEFVLDEPLIGREFMPGVRDCYALLRAWYWQERKVRLKEFPRDADWWTAGSDLFREGFDAAGFKQTGDDLKLGDVVLIRLHSPVPNHCAIVLENGLILHHLQNRLSRREPLGPWAKFVTHRLRYAGAR